MSINVAGVDVSGQYIRVSLLAARAGVVSVRQQTAAPRRSEQPLEQAIVELLRGLAQKPRQVAITLPLAEAGLRHIRLPFARREQIRKTLRFRLPQELPGSTEDTVFDFCRQPAGEKESEVLVCVAQKEQISRLYRHLSEQRFEPAMISVDVFALQWYCQRLAIISAAQPVCFVYADAERCLVIVCRDGAMVNCRSIAGGAQCAADIALTIRAFALRHQITIAHGYVAGCSSEEHHDLLAALRRELAAVSWELLSVEPEPLSAEYLIAWGSALLAGGGAATASAAGRRGFAGLFRGALPRQPQPVNLLNDIDASLRVGAVKQSLRLTAAMVVVILLLVIVHINVRCRIMETQLRGLRAHSRQVFTRLVPEVTYIVDENAQLEQRLSTIRRELASAEGIGTRGPLLADILRELSVALPTRFRVEIRQLRVDADGIVLRGLVDTERAAQGLVRELTHSPLFTGARLTRTSVEPQGVEFEMMLTTGA